MSSESIAPVMRAAWVERTPVDAFAVFTDEIGAWWPLPTHGLFGALSGGVMFRDGNLIEHATDGREAVWAEVVAWEPPTRLVVSWHPGRTADDASEVEVTFESDGEGTRVVVVHRGWESFGDQARVRRRQYLGPNAWGGVLDHFADGAEPASPTDTAGIEAAYAAFYAEAEAGGHGPAPAGEWDADQVIAHVTLNDAAILAVCQALVHRQPARFENELCQDREILASHIVGCGDRAELIERGRRQARQTVAALRRLSPEQLETAVHCRLLNNGEIMVDDQRPWGVIAIDVQCGMHLPGHTEQLANLRR